MGIRRPDDLGSARTALLALAVAAAVAAGCGSSGVPILGSGNRADVLEATRTAPGTVRLLVASCNQGPYLDEVDQPDPGTYEVLTRTRVGNTGDDCADLVELDIDPAHRTVTIVDRVSGHTFELLGTGQPAPLGLNGVWRMTTVDIGNPVAAGRTTREIPELTIRADEDAGVIEGNFGCNERRIEVTLTADTITGRPETLEGGTEQCPGPGGGSEAMVLTERTLLELLSGDRPAEVYLDGDHLEIGTLDTNAVFERVSP